jgi:muramoyltetrapeptide carboxypeptidase
MKPKILQKGDRIGLISPSGPTAGLVPHRVKKAIQMLEDLGFEVVIGKNALKVPTWTAGTGKQRADDINNFFKDKKIKAIISFVGGNHSNQILEYLDYKLIKNNPKILMGYSDVSVLHFALYKKCNLVTFYGPSALNQFAENPRILKYTEEYLKKALMQKEPIGRIEPSLEYTEEILDWFKKQDLKRPRKMKKNKGFECLKRGRAKGKLIGGCISSIVHLRGTEYWPDFKDKIFFWEIPEGEDFRQGDLIENIDSYLTDLKLSGVFDEIRGMVIGRPFRYSKEDEKELKKIIKRYFKNYNIPILYNVDIGHTDPMITVPIGVMAEINNNSFSILESGVE